MKTLKQYWNESFQRPNLKPIYDSWLDKYQAHLKEENKIIDLGCGIGNNCKYLIERGIVPVACDISEEALKRVDEISPGIPTVCFDMSEGLPFDDKSINVLIADLSLHYFDEITTSSIISEIHRVLDINGVLLCRLNSDKEMKNKGQIAHGDEIYFVMNEGIRRRFFDRNEINRFFRKDFWEVEFVDEYDLERYSTRKILWEIAMRPR